MDETLCETCGERPATRAVTVEEEGRKRPVYRCDVCVEEQAPAPPQTLNQPCDRCRKAEGSIKLTQLVNGRRRVSYICEACARRR